MKISRKDYIIEISKQHSLTSKFTSFVAIENERRAKPLTPRRMLKKFLMGRVWISWDILVGWRTVKKRKTRLVVGIWV